MLRTAEDVGAGRLAPDVGVGTGLEGEAAHGGSVRRRCD